MAWIEYPIRNRTGSISAGRYDPDTGQAQFNLGGTWQDIGQVKYNPQTGQAYNDTAGDVSNAQQQIYGGTWGWALPTTDQIWTMRLQGQQQAAQQQQAQSTAPQGSYYGAAMSPQIMMGGTPYPTGATGGGSATTTGGVTTTGIGGGATTGGGGSMATWSQLGQQYGLSARDIAAFQSKGWDPASFAQAAAQGRGWNDMMSNPPQVQQQQTTGAAVTPGDTQQPEQRALAQMAQIDPTTEALRQQLAQSYLQQVQSPINAPTPGAMPQFNLDLSRGAAAPNQADVQSYLDLYKNIDPEGYAQRSALAGQMGSFLSDAQAQAALGSQLDPGTIREVEQQTRLGQQARGNVYGTPQLVQEAMQRGSMGEARRQQRQQALGSALGQQQSYLTSGAGMGDVANQLYAQGYNRYLQGYGQQLGAQQQQWNQQLGAWQAQQNANLQRQQAALGYLGSGQTPYQAGASYLNTAQQNAANAGQNQYQYNPASLGQNYLSNQQQQYGLDIGSQSQNYFNSLQNAYGYGGAGASKNRTGAALGGAASGALSGATAGSALGPYGTVIGGAVGAIGGGLGGYYS